MIDWFVIYKYNDGVNKWPVRVALRMTTVTKQFAENTINQFKQTNKLYAGSIIAKKIV